MKPSVCGLRRTAVSKRAAEEARVLGIAHTCGSTETSKVCARCGSTPWSLVWMRETRGVFLVRDRIPVGISC